MMGRVKKIPTILGLLVLLLGVGFGVAATQYQTIFKLGASAELTPQDVRISNVTDTSFTVSWVTDKETAGFLLWGTSASLGQTQVQDSTSLKSLHFATVRGVNPNTTYFFRINSGGSEFDNNNIPWQVQTASPVPASSQSSKVISGTVVDKAGQPAAGVLVYATITGAAPLSAKTTSNGSFLIPLSIARTTDLTKQAQLKDDSLIQIFVQAGKLGVSSAQIYLKSSNPIPQMTIGETYDFKTQEPNNSSDVPSANLDLPGEDEDVESGFNLGDEEPLSGTNSQVTLESVDEGEIITTQKPQFFGEAPSGVNITITIQSDPITTTVKVPASGDWSWTPPQNLPEGEHTITISWRDTGGILRQLTRSFTVLAQEGPAFESTPSATASPTATPTKSPSPTPTTKASPTASASASPKPTATPTKSPSPTPRVSIPSTDSGVPVAGNLTPTILLSIMGIVLLIASAFLSRKAANT